MLKRHQNIDQALSISSQIGKQAPCALLPAAHNRDVGCLQVWMKHMKPLAQSGLHLAAVEFQSQSSKQLLRVPLLVVRATVASCCRLPSSCRVRTSIHQLPPAGTQIPEPLHILPHAMQCTVRTSQCCLLCTSHYVSYLEQALRASRSCTAMLLMAQGDGLDCGCRRCEEAQAAFKPAFQPEAAQRPCGHLPSKSAKPQTQTWRGSAATRLEGQRFGYTHILDRQNAACPHLKPSTPRNAETLYWWSATVWNPSHICARAACPTV